MLADARAFYDTFSTDTVVEADVRTEAKRLAKELFLNKGSSGEEVDGSIEITSATVNGQSYSATRTITKGERLRFLRLIIIMYDNDVALGGRGYYRGPR